MVTYGSLLFTNINRFITTTMGKHVLHHQLGPPARHENQPPGRSPRASPGRRPNEFAGAWAARCATGGEALCRGGWWRLSWWWIWLCHGLVSTMEAMNQRCYDPDFPPSSPSAGVTAQQVGVYLFYVSSDVNSDHQP